MSRFLSMGGIACLAALACSSSNRGGGGGAGGSGGGAGDMGGRGGIGGTSGDAGRGGTAGAGQGIGGSGGAVGSGGAAGCMNLPPTASPFNCQATFAAQVPALCATQTVYGFKHAGACGSFQVTVLSAGFYSITCAYDGSGALVGARRCEDSSVYCGDFCIDSVGWSNVPSCDPQTDACPADAGSD